MNDSIYRLEHIRSTGSAQFSSDAEGRMDGLRIVPSEPGIDSALVPTKRKPR